MLISVIIPCYREDYDLVSNALENLYEQTFAEYSEFILIEYQPQNDDIRNLVESNDQSIYIETHQQGIPAARDAGIRRSNSNCVVNMDCDSRYDSVYGLEFMTLPILTGKALLTVCDNVYEYSMKQKPKMGLPNLGLNAMNIVQHFTPFSYLEPGSAMNKQAYFNIGGFDRLEREGEMFGYGVKHALFHPFKKKYIQNVKVVLDPRRALKFQEEGFKTLDHRFTYR